MLFFLLVGQVHAAETPAIIDAFACNLASGKDAKDIDSAVAFWNQQVDKIDNEALNQYTAWIGTPIRSTNPADFHWVGISPNLNTWAKGNAAYSESDEGQAADSRFDELGTCTSELWTSELLHGTVRGPEDKNLVLETYVCNLLPGKTMDNIRAAEANFVKALKAAGIEMNVFRLSPMYTNGQADLVYFVGHDDIETFGATGTTVATTPATSMASQSFQLIMDCAAGIFNVENIRSGVAPAAD